MRKRSVNIHGHQTSITLEDEFWDELNNIAKEQNISINKIVAQIDDNRSPENNLSSAIRLHILKKLKTNP